MLGGGLGEHEEGVQLAIIGYVRELRYTVMKGARLEEAHEQLLARVRRQFARHPDIVEEQEAALAEALHLERAQRDKLSYWRKAALTAGRHDCYGGADAGSLSWHTPRRRLKAKGRVEDHNGAAEMDGTALLSLANTLG